MKRTNLALALMVASGSALAADPLTSVSGPSPHAQTFVQLDANRDGQLSFSEAFSHPQLSNAFNTLDGNADGLLSRAEVATIVR